VDLTKPYKAAASSRKVHVNVVGMTYCSAAVVGKGGQLHKLVTHFDNGCSISSVSDQFLRENAHRWCDAGGAQICELSSPVSVGMFAGAPHSIATHCVVGLPLQLGKGIYPVDLLVIPNGNFSLCLVNNFMYDYARRLWSRNFNDRQSGRFLVLPLPQRLCAPGETEPLPPAGRAPVHWYPSQRIPVSYEVCADTWTVTPVSSLASA
jgi:hypothetical protein